jgi:hypothetical protein
MTTAGDLVYGGVSGSALRLAAGTSSQVLIGGTTPAWGSVNLATMVSGALPVASLSGTGTGVLTALANNVNAASGLVTYSGQLGTPTQGVLINCTGLPIASIASLGSGVAAALALTTTGSAGGIVTATGPTISGATLSGTVTVSNAPIMSALTGYMYANGASAVTVSTTIPTTALSLSVNEIPTGVLNGVNTTFTLAHAPVSASLMLFLNGQLLRPGSGNDYTISSLTITTLFAPLSTDLLSASYHY